jgi:hypothetical protein
MRELCIKNLGRKPRDPPTIQFLGKLSELMLEKTTPVKYDDPRNPTVTAQIDQMTIPNTLIDLGAAINIINKETTKLLGITNIIPTPTMLELADRS